MPSYVLEQRVAEAVAREAGHRVSVARREGFSVREKGKNDLVTEIDTQIETFVKTALFNTFPADSVHGEEQGAEGADTARRWYVDPIDGTLNFVQGVPMYCVSIALRDGDEWVAGAIYDPNRDELFSGRRGGAPMVNGVEASVSPLNDLSEAVLATGFPPLKKGDVEDNLDNFVAVGKVTRGVRRLGSAALDLAYVATGRLDGFWEFNLNPWDTGAGAFLVELAGGRVSTADGGTHTGFERSILATNGRIHEPLLQTLRTS